MASGTGGTSTGAVVSSGNAVQLKPVEVSKALQEGEKFIKWDEDSGAGTPVTLRVDPRGFYLYWVDQNHETDLLDIATIRDTRTGQYARVPKDPKLRQLVTMGSQDTLEEKTVTVCCGADFVNLNFVNFCCTRKDIAQVWTDELLRLAYNLTQLNGSATMFLQKAHTKLCLLVDKAGKIPIKNIVRTFASNKDDRRRVEKALDASGLPSGKGDSLTPARFAFEDFYNLYRNLTQRAEAEQVFEELVGNSKRRLMSTSQLVEFLNRTQRDPRLNEILHPYANPARAKDLIAQHEPNKFNAQKGQLSFDGFLRYLMSDDNPVMAASKIDLCDDMEHPLAHYFINSSHNTYLTGHQLTGKSSVEIYRQSLLAGCRCVELDFWNGRIDEPIIVHGYTFVPDISAKEVLEAIAEAAFKTSDFPVLLSFENHCNPRQQAKIASYCRDIFGEMLLAEPLEAFPLEQGVQLPPPAALKRKIIIKNKKKHHHHHHHHHHKKSAQTVAAEELNTGNGDLPHHAPPLQQARQSSKDSTDSSDSADSSSGGEEDPPVPPTGAGHSPAPTAAAVQPAATTAAAAAAAKQTRETEAGAEISALVNYVQPVHFNSFESSEKKNRFYEMSSFDEKQATLLLKERPIEFVNYNKHQLSRVYPAGTRFDSSNFMPQVFWNAGCQLVALNYQTLDLAMQLNLGIFEYNRRCGYILKPEFMRRKDRRLDPFAESTVDGIIAGTVSISVISGQFLTDRRAGTYVEVDMYGLPADTVRKRFRTRTVPNNGINPVYGDEPFVFKKVVLPELASIRLAAYEEGGRFLGHRVLPVVGLCPGYKHVALRTELGLPLPLATLFLSIVVKDYVPHNFVDIADALANPIKYQSALDKRAEQLAVLTEDMEPELTAAGEGDGDKEGGERAGPGQTLSGSVPSLAAKPVRRMTTCRRDLLSSDTLGSASGSPRLHHRASVVASTALGGGAASLGTMPLGNDDGAASDVGITTESSGGGGTSGDMPVVTTISAALQKALDQAIPVRSPEAIAAEDIKAEPLEKLLENKSVAEKRLEMEKKLESMRKKHDKERQKSLDCGLGEKRSSKFYMSSKLVKRLSSKNISDAPWSSAGSLGSVDGEGAGAGGASCPGLARLVREHAVQLKELQEKYHEAIYSTAEKALRQSQTSQMKTLRGLLDRETAELGQILETTRRKEVKDLAKKHRDRDELIRMKREVATAIVERGVAERVRLAQDYDRRIDVLQREHNLVKKSLEEHRLKAKTDLEMEYSSRVNSVDCVESSSSTHGVSSSPGQLLEL